MSFIGKFIYQLFTHKPETCASDEQSCLRNLPKVSSHIMQTRIKPGRFASRAEFIPTTPQDCDIQSNYLKIYYAFVENNSVIIVYHLYISCYCIRKVFAILN